MFKRQKIVHKTRKNVIKIFMLQLTSTYLNYDRKKCYANVPNDFDGGTRCGWSREGNFPNFNSPKLSHHLS